MLIEISTFPISSSRSTVNQSATNSNNSLITPYLMIIYSLYRPSNIVQRHTEELLRGYLMISLPLLTVPSPCIKVKWCHPLPDSSTYSNTSLYNLNNYIYIPKDCLSKMSFLIEIFGIKYCGTWFRHPVLTFMKPGWGDFKISRYNLCHDIALK